MRGPYALGRGARLSHKMQPTLAAGGGDESWARRHACPACCGWARIVHAQLRPFRREGLPAGISSQASPSCAEEQSFRFGLHLRAVLGDAGSSALTHEAAAGNPTVYVQLKAGHAQAMRSAVRPCTFN